MALSKRSKHRCPGCNRPFRFVLDPLKVVLCNTCVNAGKRLRWVNGERVVIEGRGPSEGEAA